MECYKNLTLFNLFFVLLFCTNFIKTLGSNFDSSKLYVIKNEHLGLVLDSRNELQIVGNYDSNGYYYPWQLWRLVPANGNAGYYYITNNSTGKVLDITTCSSAQCYLRMNQFTGHMGQEWSVTEERTIRNNYRNENLEVDDRHRIITYRDDDLPHQKFDLIPQSWLHEGKGSSN